MRASAHLAPILTVPSAEGLTTLARAAESPGLRVHVGEVFPFGALADALDHLASGRAKGRGVLSRG